MAVIYLTHPVHGAKVAISNDEAIYDEEFGWMRYDPEAKADEVVNTIAPQKLTKWSTRLLLKSAGAAR